MTGTEIVVLDDGGINARLLARQAKADFRRVEGASLKMPARLVSAEGKRMFLRMFNTLQLNDYFISVIAPTRLDDEEMAKIEDALRARLDKVAEGLDRLIDETEAQFKAHRIGWGATCDSRPLDLQVAVLSSNGRRYLEVLVKMDQLMPLLQTLQILDVTRTRDVRTQRSAIKREVRNVANAARSYAGVVRKRMRDMELAERRASAETARQRSQVPGKPADPGASAADLARSQAAIAVALPEPSVPVDATSNHAQSDAVSPPPASVELAGTSPQEYRESDESVAPAPFESASVGSSTASQSLPAL